MESFVPATSADAHIRISNDQSPSVLERSFDQQRSHPVVKRSFDQQRSHPVVKPGRKTL